MGLHSFNEQSHVNQSHSPHLYIREPRLDELRHKGILYSLYSVIYGINKNYVILIMLLEIHQRHCDKGSEFLSELCRHVLLELMGSGIRGLFQRIRLKRLVCFTN